MASSTPRDSKAAKKQEKDQAGSPQAAGKRRRAKKPPEMSLDEKLAKAFSHPLRAEIVSALNERGPMSASELEAPLGENLTNIAYHMKKLKTLGFVEPLEPEPVRGAFKTKYRSLTRMLLSDETWATLSPESKAGVSFAAVREVFDRAKAAIKADTMDSRDNRHIITIKPALDEEGWEKAAHLLEETFESLLEIEADAANRSPEPSTRFPTTISILSYESPSSGPDS